MEYAAALASLTDGYGYTARPEDIRFLRLDEADIVRFVGGEHPLGMTASEYDCFKNELHDAIKADGLEDFDVRLQGSSATFYSGHHKLMPYTGGAVDRQKLYVEFQDNHRSLPSSVMLDIITDAMEKQWPPEDAQPTRRPFDVMYRLKLCEEPSDFDVQISCDTILHRAEQYIVSLGLEPSATLVRNPTYNFIQKKLVDKFCQNIKEWRIMQSSILARPVSVAAFPRKGPSDLSAKGIISSHFKDDDWVVNFDD